MVEKLNTQKFSLAAAATMGVIYVVCAAFVALSPDLALKLFGWLVHLVNVDKFAGDVQITVLGFIIGLAQVIVYTYIGALIFSLLHNKFMKK